MQTSARWGDGHSRASTVLEDGIVSVKNEAFSFQTSAYSSQLHFCCVFKHDSRVGAQLFEKLYKKGGKAPHAGPGQRDRNDSSSAAVSSTAISFCCPLPPVNIHLFSQYREQLQRSPWQLLPLTPGHLIGKEKGGQAMFSQICESYALVVPVPDLGAGGSWHIALRFYVFFKLFWHSCVPLG